MEPQAGNQDKGVAKAVAPIEATRAMASVVPAGRITHGPKMRIVPQRTRWLDAKRDSFSR